MLREGVLLGVFGLHRDEVRPFTEKQIALVTTFADQAVIAIENVRLFTELEARNTELTEALEQQTATADILRVISSSPTDVQPVFDTIVRSAVVLCGAIYGSAVRFDGELMHLVAGYNYTPEVARLLHEAFPMRPSPRMMAGRAILSRDVVQVEDALEDSDYADGVARAGGFRSMLAAPMLRDGRPIGAIVVNRGQPGSFSRSQIELLKTFADQAVIAIENVRLFTELQEKNRALTDAHAQVTETLGQQTATSEILRVISSSPTDVQPVFDAIAESAVRLCEGLFGAVFRFDGELMHFVAHHHFSGEALLVQRQYPRPPGGLTGSAILDRAVAHSADVLSDPRTANPDLARVLGYRSLLAVPILRESQAIGAIVVYGADAVPFSEQQIALLRTFAEQAVIAIENVRLFKELETRNRDLTQALEQQTATAEILRVISSSPTDLQPVFDTIVRSAVKLCGATFGGLQRIIDGRMTLDAQCGVTADEIATLQRDVFPLPISRESATGRAVVDRAVVHIRDIRDDPELGVHLLQRMPGFRTILAVPTLREGIPIGALALWRREVLPFGDTEISLVQTFADQAVIAIENVRLFKELEVRNRELTTALDTQTATSDILRVISRSQTDTQPVFDTILTSAVRLLRGHSGTLTRLAGDQIELAAHTSFDDAGDASLRAIFPQSLHSELPHAQAIRQRAPINTADMQSDPGIPEPVRASARARGYHSWVTVPMLRQDEAVGTIAVTRSEAGGFTDEEIALLQTFADQAVIAIENVRLFTELQARTAELTQSVEKLTALGEVSQALSSTLDLDTVLATIVNRAVQLSGADGGQIFEYDEVAEEFQPRASNEVEEVVAATQHTRLRKGEGAVGRMAVTREAVQIPDIALEGAYESRARAALLRSGRHALLAVPLLSEEQIVGGLVVSRNAAGAFPVEVVELLKTFATQSALAIQNARLFQEIADKSRAARGGQPAQVRVPGQHVPRAADAPQCGHRLLRGAAPADVRRAQRQAGRVPQGHLRLRPAPPVPHQRHPGPLQDRGRAHGAGPGPLPPADAPWTMPSPWSGSGPPATASPWSSTSTRGWARSSGTSARSSRSCSTSCPMRSSSPRRGAGSA